MFSTAFQENAFQNDAFQILIAFGGWLIRVRRRR